MHLQAYILDALPAQSREKLERAADAREVLRQAYWTASDNEQFARSELVKVQTLTASDGHHAYSIEVHPASALVREPEQAEHPAIASAKRILKSRVAARDRAAEAQNGFAFFENVVNWLERTTRPGGEFRAAPLPAVKPRDPAADIAAIRKKLADVDERFAAAERAPLPKADLLISAKAEIAAFAAEGALTINTRARAGDPLRLSERFHLRVHNSNSLLGDGGRSIIAHILQDQFISEAERLIAALPDAGAMTNAEREAAFASMAIERLDLERQEEAVCMWAESVGYTPTRRHDLDPRAFLMIDA